MAALLNIFRLEFGQRVYGLDILRAIAILLVVAGHSLNYAPSEYHGTLQIISNITFFDGVSIFFVLSGFLIGGILLKTLDREPATFKTLGTFWLRRWFRTLPNYYLVLTLVVVLSFFRDGVYQSAGINKYYMFFQNFAWPHPHFFSEAWSLSVEEWFYVLIPAVLFLMAGFGRMSPRYSILIVALSVIVTVAWFRYYRYLDNPVSTLLEWDLHFRKQVITRLDSIMFGLLGAYAYHYCRDAWVTWRYHLLAAGIALFGLQNLLFHLQDITVGLYYCVVSFGVTSLATLLFLPFLSQIKTGSGFLYQAVTGVSIISYSMYLLNLTPVQLYLVEYARNNVYSELQGPPLFWMNFLLFWGATIVCSLLLYKYFEKPCTELREKVCRH